MPKETELFESKCLLVSKLDGGVSRELTVQKFGKLDESHVRVRVQYSSLNYKDALCASGHPGIAKSLPMIPGIDASGTVLSDPTGTFDVDDDVMIFHSDFGTLRDGGMSQIVDVPVEWIYRIPAPLDSKSVMILGTAGFTAAQCVDELIKHGVEPDSGDIVVTGATGGVGIFAVKLLRKLGYSVTAVTGKPDRHDWLRQLGANNIIGREMVDDTSGKPLLEGKWAGAVDTVGGNILPTILRSTKPRGCVTACGLVAGADLAMTVYPFILRGVTLQGVDTAGISREYRSRLWGRLATDWHLENSENVAVEVPLEKIDTKIRLMLAGKISGRVVIKIEDN